MKFSPKSFLVIAALVSFSSIVPADVELIKSGVFKDLHPIGSFGYPDAKSCQADGGEYDNGVCIFENGGSTIEIKKIDNSKYELAISSVGTNMHTCDYQGSAIDFSAVEIISKDASGCEILIAYTSKDSISVTTNGKCLKYCGARMSLDVENANRSL